MPNQSCIFLVFPRSHYLIPLSTHCEFATAQVLLECFQQIALLCKSTSLGHLRGCGNAELEKLSVSLLLLIR